MTEGKVVEGMKCVGCEKARVSQGKSRECVLARDLYMCLRCYQTPAVRQRCQRESGVEVNARGRRKKALSQAAVKPGIRPTLSAWLDELIRAAVRDIVRDLVRRRLAEGNGDGGG